MSYMSCSCSPLFSFLEGRFLLILLFLKFSALIRDEKHFARVQGSAINKPIIPIFPLLEGNLPLLRYIICLPFNVYYCLLFNLQTPTKRSVNQAEQATCCSILTNFVNIVLGEKTNCHHFLLLHWKRAETCNIIIWLVM